MVICGATFGINHWGGGVAASSLAAKIKAEQGASRSSSALVGSVTAAGLGQGVGSDLTGIALGVWLYAPIALASAFFGRTAIARSLLRKRFGEARLGNQAKALVIVVVVSAAAAATSPLLHFGPNHHIYLLAEESPLASLLIVESRFRAVVTAPFWCVLLLGSIYNAASCYIAMPTVLTVLFTELLLLPLMRRLFPPTLKSTVNSTKATNNDELHVKDDERNEGSVGPANNAVMETFQNAETSLEVASDNDGYEAISFIKN